MVRSLIRNISYCSFRFVFVLKKKGKMKYEKFENSSAPSKCMTLPSFVGCCPFYLYFYSVLILIPCYYIVLFDRYKKKVFHFFFLHNIAIIWEKTRKKFSFQYHIEQKNQFCASLKHINLDFRSLNCKFLCIKMGRKINKSLYFCDETKLKYLYNRKKERNEKCPH